ncbi:MAG: glycoside hydrolase family 95 protein, partial [Flavitalea sp.]
MKPLFLFIGMIVVSYTSSQTKKPDPNLKLWYTSPASIWEEALPLGNAKTGAMVFGGVVNERYQLNDNTLWSGYPEPGNNPNGPTILPLVRQQNFEGNYDSAAKLWKKMQGPYSARYLPLADLLLKFNLRDTTAKKYYRDLDLNNATSTVQYLADEVNYTRESFISFPDKVMVIKISTDKKAAVNFTSSIRSKLRYRTTAMGDDYLVLKGKAPRFVANRDFEPKQIEYDDNPNGEGMLFEVHVKIIPEGGIVTKTDSQLIVKGADAVTIYLAEATSFNGFNKSPALEGKDPSIEAKENLAKASKKHFELLKQAHIKDYRSLFDRVQLDLGIDPQTIQHPIDKRLLNYGTTQKDNQLQVLYYQFGRYLMISSSRPGSRPTNLQGIWNDQVQPPWGSNYTTNINTEMNYWLAE